MECSRCGSHNTQTFRMAHASNSMGINSWDRFVKVLLFGPVGFFIKPRRNSLADITAPPEKPLPVLGLAFVIWFLLSLLWLMSVYRRDGFEDSETQTALIVNFVLFIVAAIILIWDVNRFISARRKYPEMLEDWSHSWICLRCGSTYKLPDLPPVETKHPISRAS